MDADALRALRERLRCTAKELAQTLGVEPELVTAWERGEAFPTKRWVEALATLDAKGPESIVRKARSRAKSARTPLELLADPELWSLFRKLLAHSELRRRTLELAATFDDPSG